MLKHLIWFCFGVCLQSVHPMMSQSFCDNMTIDAITYAMDSKMYLIVSDGHYWWIKGIDFPPKEEKKAKLAAPFKRPTAAVHLDTMSPCSDPAKDRNGLDYRTDWREDYFCVV